MNSLTKQLYRYTHKRNMRHNENLWPFVKISRAETGEISELKYKGRSIDLIPLSSLHHRFDGDILIAATGPSIKAIDFKTLPSTVITAGVNGAWHLHHALSFSLYFVVDMTFIDRQTALLKRIVSCKDVILFTTVMGIVKLIERFSYDKIQCELCIIEDICYETYKPSIKQADLREVLAGTPGIIFSETHPNTAFSCDVRHGVVDAGTVMYWALQVLYFLGFKKIYIAGLDMNNFNQPRFYETNSTMLPTFLDKKVNNIVIPALMLASTVFKKNEITVINLSPQSAIPDSVFPRKDFTDVFN
ncbi:sugar glycosyltransferase [Enterobacter cloacae complex sp. 2022EL-00788]|uniref:sugar glycosyltransferase n=2 Tax=Enterobacter TaxID=547 RepID=UPI00227095C9|nr:sugar glycosyltransferase [Enterobacter cloacae complex sp. 2022EL-00788]MCY0773286.1 sugar glycosyltransferase [Enterobacter cloacae complex sp. 2022EL-00788]